MLHKILIIVAVVLVLLVIAKIFSGCHHPPHFCKSHSSHEKKANWMMKKIAKELKLNEQQKVELEQIKDEILAKKAEFKINHQEIKNAVLSQVKSDTVDQAALNGLFEDKELEFKEMRAFLVDKFAEFHNILTPEQRLSLAEKMEKFHSKRHQ
ncbi:Spy/CpxP family protein refolding chaperone [candidate division KSB1 bacterium]|nr:Spy/CpxP family protein refolding chaperone [candidate division KSB1 bacterium]MBL7094027.1 Spy/CpxP family protein refolding chaperone [candidate division KSB1 bacterium]